MIVRGDIELGFGTRFYRLFRFEIFFDGGIERVRGKTFTDERCGRPCRCGCGSGSGSESRWRCFRALDAVEGVVVVVVVVVVEVTRMRRF